MRRLPLTIAILASVALFGACNCDTENPVIVCETNEDCTDEALPYCDTESEECVACIGDEHCADGLVCTDFTCVSDAQGCETDADCTEAGAEYCDTAAELCVECVTDSHCTDGAQCVDNACLFASDCDIDGFQAVSQEGIYAVTSYGPLLAYIGSTAEADPRDEMVVAWWFDYGGDYIGPGVYPVESTPSVADCGLCITIERLDAGGNTAKYFFAIEGEIEVTEASGNGQPFNGVLRDVVFAEWDLENDTAVTGGETWCVNGHNWTTTLDGDLPPPPCATDDDCTDAGFPYCNHQIGECAACSLNEHCAGAGEECLNGICRVPGACYFNDFTAATGQGFFGVTNDGPRLGYVADSAENAPLDQLNVLWWFDYGVDYAGAAVYPIAESNLTDCGLCVYVVAFDAQGEFSRLYFATEGEVEITEIAGDGEPFAGVLRNAVLVEWNPETDVAVANGLVWCVDGHEWSVELDGTPPCLIDADCQNADTPLCNVEAGACVECLADTDCGLATNCSAENVCEVYCTASGFDATVQTTDYTAPNGSPAATLRYQGATAEVNPRDEITVSWNFDLVDYIGAGLYQVEAGATPENCGLCVQIASVDAEGATTSLYFAIAGTVEISEIGTDGEVFAGVLHDVVFVQWDTELNAPAATEATWCLDGHGWETALSGPLPVFLCETDAQCTLPGVDYCHIDTGICVECVEDGQCNAWSNCIENICVSTLEGTSCSDTIVVSASGTYDGTMAGYQNDFTPGTGETSCTDYPANGPDIVFEVALAPGQQIEVSYTLLGGDGSIYITSSCLDGEPPVDHAAVCLVGADETFSGQAEVVAYTNSGEAEETVFVILDVYSFPADPAAATWDAVFTLTPENN